MKKIKVAVFVSGRGSNLAAILTSIKEGKLSFIEIVLIISSNPEAKALQLGKENNIPGIFISREQYSSDEEFDLKLLSILKEYEIDLIILAGYLKKISPVIIEKYRNKIMNIHPSLLPSFGGKGMYGINVHKAVIESGGKYTGVTVHFINEEYDKGPIILQRVVPVLDNDTPETLSDRVLKEEHKIYSEALKLFSEGKLRIEGRRVYIESL